MKRGGFHLPLKEVPCLRSGRAWPRVPGIIVIFVGIVLVLTVFSVADSAAQAPSDNSDTIRGTVINSATHTGIDRALVLSPDNRFAALTNSEGRFEFRVPQNDPGADSDANPNGAGGQTPAGGSKRPFALMARKPGYITDPNQQANNIQNEISKDLTLVLIPEGVIEGTVTLPTSEAPDSITLQIYRWQIQDGLGHWIPAGATESRSDGTFRFADLPGGSYKLLTSELLDTDPLTYNARIDPLSPEARGPLFGYPPVYYQSASDFGSATIIPLSAGQTQAVNLSLVKKPYYRVKLPVIDQSEYGIGVNVYAGHRGPGFALGYNPLHHAVEGMLPSGTYTVEATSVRANGATIAGSQSISIKGATVEGPGIALSPAATIAITVREEFTAADRTSSMTVTRGARTTTLNGPRRYLSVMLSPADDFGMGQVRSLRPATDSGDDALVIEGIPPGRYWVRVQSSRGYPSSVRSGNIDLLHHPLVVGMGGASPIEITMRDDTAEISGTVEGMPPPPKTSNADASAMQSWVHVYCVPLADSGGQFADIWVNLDGTFASPAMPPGAYRLFAFDRPQAEMEYRNPEAMESYDAKGTVVRVAGGQKEHVTLQLIAASASSNDQ